MKIEILKTADKYYDDNTMAKELACIEMLEGLAWDINSTKHVLKRCENDVKDALSGGMMDYAKIRKKAVLEYRQELEDKKNKFKEVLTFLNNL
jgi:hypothetical protein